MRQYFLLTVICVAFLIGVQAFSINQPTRVARKRRLASQSAPVDPSGDGSIDGNEIVAKTITVTGDVQGGYYRACVLNEAGRFRHLVGTMSPPDDTKTAQIYVEGKQKMVDGFIRWCRKGNVGLSQVVTVDAVKDEEPTGLYDGFYVKTK